MDGTSTLDGQEPGASIVRGPPLETEAGIGAKTLAGFLHEVAARFSDREALVQTLPDGTIERLSYADVRQHALGIAAALVAGGFGKGERVGILMSNRVEFVTSAFGIALAGGVVTPISTFSTGDELAYLIEASSISVLLFEPGVARKDFRAMLQEIEPGLAGERPGALRSERFPYLRRVAALDTGSNAGCVETWDMFLASGKAVAQCDVLARGTAIAPCDPAALFFSSGSTGRPKGVLSAQRAVAIQMWRMRAQQGLDETVRMWTANGFFWSGNFAMVLGGTLAAGGCIVLQSVFRAHEALALMERERVSFLFAWPHQWQQLVEATGWASTDLSSLRFVDRDSRISEHPTVRTDWIEPRHCYGNTETFTLVTACPAGTTRGEAGDSHGVVLPGNTVKIVDPFSGATMPRGEAGEIAVKGPTLMLGYLGVPADETFDDEGFFRTGDGGRLDDRGHLHWSGRLNDIIKTGGANVSPVEVDEIARRHPGVKIAQTVGVPHETLGELVVTCVVPREGATIDEADLRAFVAARLASYKTPRRVLQFDEADMGMTGSAKIRTADLRAMAARRLAEADTHRRTE